MKLDPTPTTGGMALDAMAERPLDVTLMAERLIHFYHHEVQDGTPIAESASQVVAYMLTGLLLGPERDVALDAILNRLAGPTPPAVTENVGAPAPVTISAEPSQEMSAAPSWEGARKSSTGDEWYDRNPEIHEAIVELVSWAGAAGVRYGASSYIRIPATFAEASEWVDARIVNLRDAIDRAALDAPPADVAGLDKPHPSEPRLQPVIQSVNRLVSFVRRHESRLLMTIKERSEEAKRTQAVIDEAAALSRRADGAAAGVAVVPSQAAQDVFEERRAQIEQWGFTAEHDDVTEAEGQMAGAAACYAFGKRLWTGEENGHGFVHKAATVWPWAEHWWKPTTRRRNLVKAGALILAEIERLDRATPHQERGQ